MKNKKIIKIDPKKIDKWFLINKYNNPIVNFYELLAVESGNELAILDGKRANVSSIIINKDLYNKEVLKRIMLKYVQKNGGEFLTKKRIEVSIAMYDLNYGPRISEEVPEDEIWLLSDWLIDN